MPFTLFLSLKTPIFFFILFAFDLIVSASSVSDLQSPVSSIQNTNVHEHPPITSASVQQSPEKNRFGMG
jgi:hypothetical protein